MLIKFFLQDMCGTGCTILANRKPCRLTKTMVFFKDWKIEYPGAV